MNVDESVTRWIDGLREGSPSSAQQLWERYFQQLVRLAGRKLPAGIKRGFDEEDIALSAFNSLCQGVKHGRFPRLDDRNNLWSLLVVITARKVTHHVRDERAFKRGGGNVRGESVFCQKGRRSVTQGINQVIGHEPSAEFAARVCEQSERLLNLLPDEDMRLLAVLKMEGYTNAEAAEKLQCGVRTVDRRLALIRKLWSVRGDQDG